MSDSELNLRMNRERFEISEEFLEKYNRPGPRYTSYPTAPVWQDDFGPDDLEKFYAVADRRELPFRCTCIFPFATACVFFARATSSSPRTIALLLPTSKILEQEINHVSRFVSRNRPIVQFHWGGGTPTYLTPEQMEQLFRYTAARFTFAPDAEIGIEIDPRVTTRAHLETLRRLGFNRLSMGIQDFHPEVQEVIHRVQPLELTRDLIIAARELGFDSINVDLIYGLPLQTAERFAHTVEQVVALSPDRVAMFSYAHVPWLRKQQGAFATKLPEGMEKFRIFRSGLERFQDAGYQYIGMDHFARPTDELAVAQRTERCTAISRATPPKPARILYGMGVSAISGLGACYAQNDRDVAHYRERVEQRGIATIRGYRLSADDLLRRTVISRILCHGILIKSEIEKEFGIDFDELLLRNWTAGAVCYRRPGRHRGRRNSDYRCWVENLHPKYRHGLRSLSGKAKA